MEDFTQKDRLIRVDTVLGEDTLLLRSFSGEDHVSKLFRYELDMLSLNHELDLEALIGTKLTVSVTGPDRQTRYHFNGFVSRISQGDNDNRYAVYHAEVVPFLWLLSLETDCRIYQDKTTKQIIEDVLQRHDFRSYSFDVDDSHKREFCVQYRETTLAFIMRLMEEDGFFFYFSHSDDDHTLHIADKNAAFKTPAPGGSVPFAPAIGARGERQDEGVRSWKYQRALQSERYAVNDFNFKTPSADLSGSAPNIASTRGQAARGELYDYPGLYTEANEAYPVATKRIGASETWNSSIEATSSARKLAIGHKFTLRDHTRRDQNGDYVITSIRHTAQDSTYPGLSGVTDYANAFTCIPASVRFVPQCVTPRPVISGLQTAIVTGASGSEIHTDEYGRVKLKFHWDRHGRGDDTSSCWIRSAQFWAGSGWGAIFIPRVGDEIVVAFQEGDPDRPLVVGSVYNEERKPPYDLPANKTQSGIKSRTSLNGGNSNKNEMRFEDSSGSEQIYVHAERDLDEKVKRNRTSEVDKDDSLTVLANRDIKVMGNHTEKVMATIDVTGVGGIMLTSPGGITLTAPMVTINAPAVAMSGVLTVQTVITQSVVSPLYTPGVGNLI
jgi:type VI secretion system secreted protein VgrG